MHLPQHLTCTRVLQGSDPAVLPHARVTHKGQAGRHLLIAELDGAAEQDQGNVVLQAGAVELLVQDQAVWAVLLQREAGVNSPHRHRQIWRPWKQNRAW